MFHRRPIPDSSTVRDGVNVEYATPMTEPRLLWEPVSWVVGDSERPEPTRQRLSLLEAAGVSSHCPVEEGAPAVNGLVDEEAIYVLDGYVVAVHSSEVYPLSRRKLHLKLTALATPYARPAVDSTPRYASQHGSRPSGKACH